MKLTHKVLLLLIVSIVGTFSMTTVIELRKLRQEFSEQHEIAHKIILANLMSNLAGAMFNIDERRVRAQALSSFEFGDITSLILIDDKAHISCAMKRESGKPGPADAGPRDLQGWSDKDLEKFREPLMPYRPVTLGMIQDQGMITADIHRYQAALWHSDDDRPTFVGHIIFDFSTAEVARKVQKAALTKILSATAVASIMLFGIFFFLKLSVLSRLEKLKSAVNQIKARDFTARIPVSGNDEIAMLAGAFQSMSDEIQSYQTDLETKVKVRTRELQESRDKIKMVFDTIDQGIVSFDGSYKVDSEYSRKTLDILAVRDVELLQEGLRSCLIDKLDLSSDQKDLFHASVLSIIDSDELALESNCGHLPNEASMTDPSGMKRYFRLAWHPIMNLEDGLITSLLLSITDLTHEKKQEEQKRQLTARNRQLLTLVAAAQVHSLSTLENFLKQSLKSLETLQRPTGDANTLIALHTIKGEARMLGFVDLSTLMHDAEMSWKKEGQASATAVVRAAHEVLAGYQSVYEQTFQRQNKAQTNFVQCAARIYQNVSERLQTMGHTLAAFEIVDHCAAWDEELLERVISPCLMHAVNNSLDHGFLLPEVKYRERRPIHLSLKARPIESGFAIEISDRGYGVNEDEVLKKARDLGLAIDSLNVLDILFLPEFSTAEKVSMTSGRGVGMSAIKQIVESHQGRVKFQTRFKEGTTLTLEFLRAQAQVLARAG
ncbi:MAG: HAMP domain-containing protein [Pseudobdellovibrionaceae bacterium]|nr:HAMP domain-containing protein [Pseudobdellovibrionaceae bacterium]